MAVALGSVVSAAPATGTTFTSGSWTLSGSNLAILIAIGLDALSGAVSVSSVSWSLGSGTPVLIQKVQVVGTGGAAGFGSTTQEIWAIPAPAAGSGTYTVNLSASRPYQISAAYFTGADQTTPCPISDAMTISNSDYPGSGAFTFNPTNVAAADGIYAAMSHSNRGDSNGWTTGTNDFENKTTTINMTAAHNLGASVTCVAAALINTPTDAVVGGVGVRIQAPAGAAPAPRPRQRRAGFAAVQGVVRR